MDGTRPKSGEDEIDRTGRDEQVSGQDAGEQSGSGAEFGVPGSPAEEPPEGHENDFA